MHWNCAHTNAHMAGNSALAFSISVVFWLSRHLVIVDSLVDIYVEPVEVLQYSSHSTEEMKEVQQLQLSNEVALAWLY